jgi:hypothetical protein
MKSYLLLAAALLATGCQSTHAPAQGKDQPTRVKELVVVDDAGRDRVWIGSQKLGERSVTGIFLLDESGTRRLLMGTMDEGSAGIVQYDDQGKRRMFVGTSDKINGAGMAVMDATGKPRVHIGTGDDGSGEVHTLDVYGQPVAELTVPANP